jgi:hypothetical protein
MQRIKDTLIVEFDTANIAYRNKENTFTKKQVINDSLNVLKKLQTSDAIVATGTFGSGWTEPNLGAGTRMLWYPRKAAFRAGGASGTDWDNDSIGDFSVSFGFNTKASGYASVALGDNAKAIGFNSLAFGYETKAIGVNSTAFGYETKAISIHSTAFGFRTTTTSINSFVIGQYNIGGGNSTNWVDTDPLFEIGNGTSVLTLSNAFEVKKNGNTIVGGTLKVGSIPNSLSDTIFVDSAGNVKKRLATSLPIPSALDTALIPFTNQENTFTRDQEVTGTITTTGYISAATSADAAPELNTGTGTKYAIVVSTTSDNAFGIGRGPVTDGKYPIWFQTGNVNGWGWKWYNGITEIASLDRAGDLAISGTMKIGNIPNTLSDTAVMDSCDHLVKRLATDLPIPSALDTSILVHWPDTLAGGDIMSRWETELIKENTDNNTDSVAKHLDTLQAHNDRINALNDSLENIYTDGQVDALLLAKQNISDTNTVDATKYWVLNISQNQLSQGLKWNQVTDTYTRLGSISSVALGASPGDGALPIQSQIKGCVINDAGVVQYYLQEDDWSYKADHTASNLTGADGQVMVEIPKFYYKHDTVGNSHEWWISLYPLTGFAVHPAFEVNGVVKSFMYIGAYEGILYDNSASIYANGLYLPTDTVTFANADTTITIAGTFPTNGFTSLAVGDKIVITGTVKNDSTFTVKTIGDKHIHVTEAVTNETANATVISTQRDYTASTGDKLSSVSGKVPVTYLTRANARVLATNRGTGWHQLGYDEVHAIEVLGLIEYGSFYWQNIAAIGPGITAVTDEANYNNNNPFVPSGNGNSIGNASGDNAGATSCATEKSKYSRYRGISNFYGHVFKWVDGINVNNNHPYVTNNYSSWADDTSTGYTDLGVTLAVEDGCQKTLVNSSRLILPRTVGGSGATYITDYYKQSTGWQVAALGGYAGSGTPAGAWSWILNIGSGYVYQHISARVAF